MKRTLFSIFFLSSILSLFCSGDLVKVPLSLSSKRLDQYSSDHPLDRRLSSASYSRQHHDHQRRLISPVTSGSNGLGSIPSINIPSSGSGIVPSISGLGSGTSGSIPSIGSGSFPSIGSGSLPNYGSGSLPSIGSGSIPKYGSGSLPTIGSGSLPSIGSGSIPGLPSLPSTQSNTPSALPPSSNTNYSKSFSNDASACSSYILINTRGTGEMQGPSAAFTAINSQVMAAIPGGKVTNTAYLADYSQDSSQGTKDIVAHITSEVNACYILEGYSQGAAATVNALSALTGAAFDAVKAVFLVGNPLHKSGLSCNVDNMGGTTTRNVNGVSAGLSLGFGTASSSGIPPAWVNKTLDVCISGDDICDSSHGVGVNTQHLSYLTDSNTQKLGVAFITAALSGKEYIHSK